jgi:hypothetical protein
MPVSPDFEQIARRTVGDNAGTSPNYMAAAVAEQLRQVWNARGEADIAKIDSELSMLMGATMAGPYVKNLDRALRTVDR